MNPIGESLGKKWVIIDHETVTRYPTVQDRGAVCDVYRWWAGMLWVNDESLAMRFDSETVVNEYIERNRARLET